MSSHEHETLHNHPGADRAHEHGPHTHTPVGEAETLQLREEQVRARATPVDTGRVRVAKEVVSEQRDFEVPVAHEEVFVDRRPVERTPSDTPVGSPDDASIRLPVHEEQVVVDKRPVVTEEIEVGTRAVHETERVSATVRREEARIATQGDIHAHDED